MLVAENEPQETKLVRPASEGGYGLDGLWNDDFHHSALVALTGRNEAYYTDYRGRPQEFISAAKYGYLFQGQPYLAGSAARRSRLWVCVPTPSSASSRITIRWRIPPTANACALRLRRALSRDDGAALARAVDADACSKARNSARPRPSFIFADFDGDLRAEDAAKAASNS